MAEEFATQGESELLKGTGIRPTLKAVQPPDPHRRTKQMLDQFAKIKEGLQTDLTKAQEERNQLDANMDDLELAIRVISSAQAMLDVEKQPS
ncbi:hypothetical protein EHM76_04275 [bacterium]|nr:MAG: hypothetical protein EHM76_04275 [bacterium]